MAGQLWVQTCHHSISLELVRVDVETSTLILIKGASSWCELAAMLSLNLLLKRKVGE